MSGTLPRSLLAALAARPCAAAWRDLCRALERVNDRTVLDHLGYLLEALEGWPDEVRVAPPGWAASLFTHSPDPRLQTCRALRLGGAGVVDLDAVDLFVEHLSRLSVRHLDLSWVPLGVHHARRVAEHIALAHLTRLEMAGTFVEGAEVVWALSTSPHLASLTHLDLSHNDLTDLGAHALASTRTLKRLRTLLIRNANPDAALTSDGAWALAHAEHLTALERLDLTGSAVGARGARALATSTLLPALKRLTLTATPASDPGPAAALGDLDSLQLTGPWPGPAPSSSDRLSELRELTFAPPGQVVWHAICDLFNDWPEAEDLQLGLDYANQHLGAWPDAMRRAPWHWNQTLLHHAPDPRLAICRHVEVEPQRTLIEDRFDHLREIWKRLGFTALTLVGFDVDAERTCLQRLDLPHVKHLALPRHRASGLSVVRTALTSASFAEVTSLDLRYSQVGPALIDALCRAPLTPSLTTLLLDGTHIGAAVASLARADLTHLRTLGLEGVRLGPEALSRLLDRAELPSLSHLRLSNNPLGYQAVVPLLRDDRLPALRTLELDATHLTRDALHALCQAPCFRRLHALHVGHNRLGREGLRPLVDAAPPSLHTLGLAATHVDAPALRDLHRMPHLLDLESLDLGHNPIKDDGAVQLAQIPWARLTTLRLPRAMVGDRGATALAESPHLRALLELELERNPLGDRGATALLRSHHLAALRWLNLVRCRLDAPHLDALERIRPLRYGLEPRFGQAVPGE